MDVVVDGRKAKVKGSPKTAAELLRSLSIPREEALVRINGKLASDSARISPKDDVRVLRVIFGG